tara:strand:- start:574 stop:699 length:126 start_codon:yes stop_codon:yes gene_type:complete
MAALGSPVVPEVIPKKNMSLGFGSYFSTSKVLNPSFTMSSN